MKTIEHKGHSWNFEHFFVNNGERFMRISVGKGSKYFAANVKVVRCPVCEDSACETKDWTCGQ